MKEIHTDGGLVTLGPTALRVRQALDSVFVRWAAASGAQDVLYPPLTKVADLARFDYFVNFPHLALAAAPVDTTGLAGLPKHPAAPDARLEEDQLGPAGYTLSSAACYGAYLGLAGERLAGPLALTTAAQCYRREREYTGLSRLLGFTMREIVMIGDPATAKAHLVGYKELILGLSAHLKLDLTTDVATDPFFDPNSSRATMQRLFPVKEEFLTGDGVAIASVNYHRNFFGERAGISVAGKVAHTSCVAFGLERWLHALSERFGGGWDAALDAVLAFDTSSASDTDPAPDTGPTSDTKPAPDTKPASSTKPATVGEAAP
ncbi:hypothetical protein [Actinomadura rubrisoli]|uniref:hypothetical protein n=1 Tax=Actinomadura rubrisoli TaxID=2530368 RepID=UPI001A9FDEB2|nr:hypothetical protein [Actinomadura rubrisoli]